MDRERIADDIVQNSRLSFSRAGGSGGQNVNKVNTRVTVHVPVSTLRSLTEEQQARVRVRLAGRITENDELVVHVDEERSQLRNREIALRRLFDLITQAAADRRQRRPTRPSNASRERRMQEKRRHGRKKDSRRGNFDNE
ncbi:MAG TPA: alternative ribosome rescue aminoacyl-tRNA hydrolase ArfB [Spirochaetia bacterium]|nr:alternative ribosome rescue aminoacyl-tRNA hydrolase ArfB [Spirochaetia bacterium]